MPLFEPSRANLVVPAVEVSCTPAPAAGVSEVTGAVAAGAAAGEAEEDWQKKAEAPKMARPAAPKKGKHEDEEQKEESKEEEISLRTALTLAKKNLDAGDMVLVQGLLSEAGRMLNGSYGLVESIASSRVGVRLCGGQLKSLKPENLEAAGPAGIDYDDEFDWQPHSFDEDW